MLKRINVVEVTRASMADNHYSRFLLGNSSILEIVSFSWQDRGYGGFRIDTAKQEVLIDECSRAGGPSKQISKESFNGIYAECRVFTLEYEFESGETLGVYNYVKR